MRNASFVVGVLLGAAACASGSGGSGGAAPARAAGGGATLITQEEIARTSYTNALEIVEGLRPSMLRSRGMTMGPIAAGTSSQAASVSVIVFLDEVRLGETDRLSSIAASSVREIRYINARDATTRWGTGVSSGVIQVISKR